MGSDRAIKHCIRKRPEEGKKGMVLICAGLPDFATENLTGMKILTG